MKRFLCHICKEHFLELNVIIKHLKSVHFYKDGKQKIPCVFGSNHCAKTFMTFSGLRNHIKWCVLLENTENEVDEIVEEPTV